MIGICIEKEMEFLHSLKNRQKSDVKDAGKVAKHSLIRGFSQVRKF